VIIVLLGPPGAGKGTQGERLAARLNVPKIATGDVFRAAVRDGTPLGLKAKEYMDRGDLVPDEVILGIMKEVLESREAERGAILDGVVRTVPQAEGFSAMVAELGRNIDAVLLFEVDDEELVRRLSGRTMCAVCQTAYTGLDAGAPCPKNDGGTLIRRKDDDPEAVRNRLKVYHSQTEPVIAWYEAHDMPVHHIDAVGSVDEVTSRALSALEAAERA
jgi:adenylate kinase